MEELYHHGIMGMKWGVRRFQNKDGSLTAAGKERMAKVATNERLARQDTKTAINVYSSELRTNTLIKNKADKKQNAYKKKIEKSKQNGNVVKQKKYEEKFNSQVAKGKKALNNMNTFSKKLNDISEGNIKAGRDFFVQRDYNVYLYPIYVPGRIAGAGVTVNRTETVIEKKKK